MTGQFVATLFFVGLVGWAGWRLSAGERRRNRRRRTGFGISGRRRHSYSYDWYIHSRVWRARRRLWFVTGRGRRCSVCRSRLAIRGGSGLPVVQYHHLHYGNLGHERYGRDVVGCCPGCHPRLDAERVAARRRGRRR